ncbi:phosphatidylinositol-binding protein scs2 [Nowakowskiella sp. JEL0407]|nr:phosphatidylinositol-binding protein scs2 [Nowakowskiella sp. JEL0407]
MDELEYSFLGVEPDKELSFTRPLTNQVKKFLVISNNDSSSPIAFKVKTTAPKQYCVRPNSGKLLPGASAEVLVLLQAMKEDPPLDFKCKDKFLIQGLKISDEIMSLDGEESTQRLAEAWAAAEALKKSHAENADLISEKKLRVTFLSSTPAANIPPPPSYEATPTKSSVADTHNTSDKRTTIYSTPSSSFPHHSQPSTKSTLSEELSEAKDGIRRLQMQVDGYKAEIERLNALRYRKTTASSAVNTPEAYLTKTVSVGGQDLNAIPLHIVRFTRNLQDYKISTDFLFDAGHLSKQIYSPNQVISAKLTIINNFDQYDISDFLVVFRGYIQSYDSRETARRSDFANYTPLPLAAFVNDKSVNSTLSGSVELFSPIAVKVIPLDKQTAEFHIQIPNKYLPSQAQNKHGVIQYDLMAINDKKMVISEPRKIKFEGCAPIHPPLTAETIKKSEKTDVVSIEVSVESKDTYLSFYSSHTATSDLRKIPYQLLFTPTSTKGKKLKYKIETKVLYKGRFRGHPDFPKVVYNSTNEVEIDGSKPTNLPLSIDVYPTSMAISGPITIPSRHYVFDEPGFLPNYDRMCIDPIFTNSYELEITITKVSGGLMGMLGKSSDALATVLSVPLAINMSSKGPKV